MKKILFVDAEPDVLEKLKLMLAPLRQEWEMTFVQSGQAALDKLAQEPFGVVIADMRMPDMTGAQLLTEVRTQHPHVLRMILSDQDRDTTLQTVGSAHQWLPKACDSNVFRDLVTRAGAVHDLLEDEALRKLVAGMETLPSLPTLYRSLMAELQSENASIANAAKIISQDMGMVTKILQVVNSPFYGLRTRISSAAQAVGLLGLDTIKSLVLSMKVFSQFEGARQSFFSLDVLWQHGMVTSRHARAIAKEAKVEQRLMEDAFTAGLLHDVGLLVLANNLPDQYTESVAMVQSQGIPEWQAERNVFGASHAEVGAYLLGIWGLSDAIVEAVAFHHEPVRSMGHAFSALTAIHVANAIDEETQAAGAGDSPIVLDAEYLGHCGIGKTALTAWCDACLSSTDPA
ncbi:MAG TPA: response regulator [Nitrospiraceae bacterium]|nr:response regulator [Nitrospiraceae bacterium]